MNFTEEERETYEGQIKWFRMEFSALKKYEQKYREEGREKGREEGREEGREKGIQIGEAGLIKKMLTNGNSIETISKMTGLSVNKIKKLI